MGAPTRSQAIARSLAQRIVEGRLYLALLDATRAHYFGAALPEFERIVESARIR